VPVRGQLATGGGAELAGVCATSFGSLTAAALVPEVVNRAMTTPTNTTMVAPTA
jgi:hypothetical protein